MLIERGDCSAGLMMFESVLHGEQGCAKIILYRFGESLPFEQLVTLFFEGCIFFLEFLEVLLFCGGTFFLWF